MADRREEDNTELERELRDLGVHLARGRTPDVKRTVLERVREKQAHTRGHWRLPLPLRRGLAVVSVTMLVAASILEISPDTRAAVAQWLGLPGIEISSLPFVPKPESTHVGAGLKLGEQVTLQEAGAKVPYRILKPTLPELETPDEVYWSKFPRGGLVSLGYHTRRGLPASPETKVGLLITEFHAGFGSIYFSKQLGPGTRLEQVSVNGNRGYWIEGARYLFSYKGEDGKLYREHSRLAGNTLMWEVKNLTLRMESSMSKAEALRIARSVR